VLGPDPTVVAGEVPSVRRLPIDGRRAINGAKFVRP
jgi:hypothetical protein